MRQGIVIDVLNDEVFKILQNLEQLHLIKLHLKNKLIPESENRITKYKGRMKKQLPAEINNQLKELRNSWE